MTYGSFPTAALVGICLFALPTAWGVTNLGSEQSTIVEISRNWDSGGTLHCTIKLQNGRQFSKTDAGSYAGFCQTAKVGDSFSYERTDNAMLAFLGGGGLLVISLCIFLSFLYDWHVYGRRVCENQLRG